MDKETVQIIASFATPCIAIIAVFYTRMQARTNEIKRKQEPFDLRYAFYQKVRRVYISIAQEGRPVDVTDFFDLAEEASLIW